VAVRSCASSRHAGAGRKGLWLAIHEEGKTGDAALFLLDGVVVAKGNGWPGFTPEVRGEV
jgi:hypothetical protein